MAQVVGGCLFSNRARNEKAPHSIAIAVNGILPPYLQTKRQLACAGRGRKAPAPLTIPLITAPFELEIEPRTLIPHWAIVFFL